MAEEILELIPEITLRQAAGHDRHDSLCTSTYVYITCKYINLNDINVYITINNVVYMYVLILNL